MKKLFFLGLVTLALVSCTTDDLKSSTPTPTQSLDLKPAIVNVTGKSKTATGKSTVVDSTHQRLIYTISADLLAAGDELHKTFYRYDEKGRLVKIEMVQADGEFSTVRTYAYDDNDVMTQFTDP